MLDRAPRKLVATLLAATLASGVGCMTPYAYGPGAAAGAIPSRPAPGDRAAGYGAAGAAIPGVNGGPAACRYALSQGNPLLTEWPASEKANLETMLRGGAIAVEFTGCAMKLLPGCRLGGRYLLDRTTLATDSIEIKSSDELLAKLPLGAASLEGELKRTGKLLVKTQVAGQARLSGLGPDQVPSSPECARATHLVGGLSVGAFSLLAGGEVSGGGSASFAKIGEAGGKASRSLEQLRSAGDPDSCTQGDQYEPHFNCRSPIQAFLWRIPGRGGDAEAPAGTIKVDLISGNAAARWDVYFDDQVICTTPCSKWLDPSRPLLFRTRDEGYYGRGADKVRVEHLMPFANTGMVQVAAMPTSQGQLATGIVFTSFGGMAVVTGLALAGVGCSDTAQHGGMCSAGLTTLLVGGLVTAGSILLMVNAMPRAEFRLPGGSGTLTLGPGYVGGAF
jgi:hypothetical protein